MKKHNQNTKLGNMLEIPRELCCNVPKITIVGFDELMIENYKGILEYEDIFVRISTHIGIIDISGLNLNLNQMTEDDILVSR